MTTLADLVRAGFVLKDGALIKAKDATTKPQNLSRPIPAEDGWLVLPYPPSVNRYLGASKTGRFFKTKEGKTFDAEVKRICALKGIKPLLGELVFTMRLYRPRKCGDVHNYGKQLADALQGFLYEDDKQIVEFHAYRFDDKENPRVEVRVTQA